MADLAPDTDRGIVFEDHSGHDVDSSHNLIVGWTAKLDDGTVVTMDELRTWDNVPAGRAAMVSVKIAGLERDVHMSCVPSRGEQLFLFTKRAIKFGPNGTNGGTLNMPVLEVRSADGTYYRLYVHPVHGCIFSTLDLFL